MCLAIIFGNSLLGVLGAFPNSILGVMLFFSGIELASTTRDVCLIQGFKEVGDKGETGEEMLSNRARESRCWITFWMTLGGIVGFQHDGVGVLLGIGSWLILTISEMIQLHGVKEGIYLILPTFYSYMTNKKSESFP